jgi:membrane-associated protease RseP (regulator of RpoE activity)
MDVQLTAAILFFAFLSLYVYLNRKKVVVQKILFPVLYFFMFKTKLGIASMESLAKRYQKTLKFLGYAAVVVGFLGMALICFELIRNLVSLFMHPKTAAASVGLVLPFEVKGAFYVPFIYWIISIFFLAIIHEFSHGVIARRYGIPVKSSGFAFLAFFIPVLPAAFVEPDEKRLVKKKAREQLAVFAAGPFANIVAGFVVLGIMIVGFNPVLSQAVQEDGVLVTGLTKGNVTYPAEEVGMHPGETILSIDGTAMLGQDNFTVFLKEKKPGDIINIVTNESSYLVTLTEHPEKAGVAYLGVNVQQNTKLNEGFIAKYGKLTADILIWIYGLLFWLYLLNLGIGLFNLVPLGPIDGGRMVRVVLLKYFDEKKADRIWKYISVFFLAVIFLSLTSGWFLKL